MTEEEIKALQDELAKAKEENDKLRKANTNAAADASKYKKALQEKMSEEEKKSAEREESQKQLMEELETLRKEKSISDHVSQFVSAGYTEELARSSAKAMVEGDFKSVFGDLKSFLEAHDKEVVAQSIKNTPKPGAGNGTADEGAKNPWKKETFNLTEQGKLMRSDPEAAKQMALAAGVTLNI